MHPGTSPLLGGALNYRSESKRFYLSLWLLGVLQYKSQFSSRRQASHSHADAFAHRKITLVLQTMTPIAQTTTKLELARQMGAT
jgi:hypothetical protein